MFATNAAPSVTDLSTLTDTELNDRINVLAGTTFIVDFTTSLDALKSGPEMILRETGWTLNYLWEKRDGDWFVEWISPDGNFIDSTAPTEERARAEAVCQGLEVSK